MWPRPELMVSRGPIVRVTRRQQRSGPRTGCRGLSCGSRVPGARTGRLCARAAVLRPQQQWVRHRCTPLSRSLGWHAEGALQSLSEKRAASRSHSISILSAPWPMHTEKHSRKSERPHSPRHPYLPATHGRFLALDGPACTSPPQLHPQGMEPRWVRSA